jgi:preprotein translocase subunit SecD
MSHIPRWKIFLVIAICVVGIFYALPNMTSQKNLDSLPSWFPRDQVNLGLDLQGGSHLLLEVDLEVVLNEHLEGLMDAVRTALRKEKIGYTHLKVDHAHNSISFDVRNANAGDTPLNLSKIVSMVDSGLELIRDDHHVTFTLSPLAIEKKKKAAVAQSIEIIRRRIDENGTKEPTIQQQGENRIVLQLPGVDNPAHVKDLLGQTAKLSFRLVDESTTPEDIMANRIPIGSEVLEGEKDDQGRSHPFAVKKQVVLTGETLTDAKADFDQYNKPIVSFVLDAVGARKFGDVTKANTGKRFAIILDGQVVSAPVINEPIYGGKVQITGRFTVEEATNLALLLRAGALPAPLLVLEERTVGPDLGADSILAGQHATIFSIALIAIFMVLAYAGVGIIADIAMIFNLVFLVSAMSLLGATLTLPGIAGIALTLGMAVDANVLINERIKEELRNGKRIMVAIDAGYNRAMATIVDSNVTTLIGSMLLYIFGTGAIRGFAVTLSVGILISMFTAVTMSRVILVSWVKWKKPKNLWI